MACFHVLLPSLFGLVLSEFYDAGPVEDPASHEDAASDEKLPPVKIDLFLRNDTDRKVPEYLRFDSPFQDGFRCGPNSVFGVLRLLGVKVSYDEMMQHVETTDKGTSMQQLQDLAAVRGVELAARKGFTIDDLVAAPKPMILHLNGTNKEDDIFREDHFLVLIHSDTTNGRRFFSFIDSTNFLPVQYRADQIARAMSGYGLVVTSSGGMGQSGLMLLRGMVGLLFVVDLILAFTLWRRTSASNETSPVSEAR